MDRESGKKTLLPTPSLLALCLSLLSLKRRDPTRAGLNWAGHVDGEQGRGMGHGAIEETGWAQGRRST